MSPIVHIRTVVIYYLLANVICCTNYPKFYSIIFYYFLFYSILFYAILFYSILFYSILFYSIPFHSIPFYLFYSILFYSILSVLCCAVLSCSVLFHFIPFHSIPFHSILFYSILPRASGQFILFRLPHIVSFSCDIVPGNVYASTKAISWCIRNVASLGSRINIYQHAPISYLSLML